jgi:hypothetical protein
VRFDFQFQYIPSDQLRLNDDKAVKVGDTPPGAHDFSKTYNRSVTLSADVSVSPNFGFTVIVPFIDRDHLNADGPDGSGAASTLAVGGLSGFPRTPGSPAIQPAGHTTGPNPDGRVQQWDYTGIGDPRIVARYAPLVSLQRSAGIVFGVKLPVAPNDVVADDGLEPDKAVQPGTGSVDLIWGGYYRQSLSGGASAFAQFTAQNVVYNYPDYKPPDSYALDFGYRRPAGERFAWMLQLNTVHRGLEGGTFGLPQNSGSTVVSISPGISYSFTRSWQAYAFYQQPVFQYYQGAQVVPDYAALAGISYLR